MTGYLATRADGTHLDGIYVDPARGHITAHRYGEDTHRAALQALALVRVCEEMLDGQAKASLTTAMEMRDAADTSGRHRQ